MFYYVLWYDSLTWRNKLPQSKAETMLFLGCTDLNMKIPLLSHKDDHIASLSICLSFLGLCGWVESSWDSWQTLPFVLVLLFPWSPWPGYENAVCNLKLGITILLFLITHSIFLQILPAFSQIISRVWRFLNTSTAISLVYITLSCLDNSNSSLICVAASTFLPTNNPNKVLF